VIARCWSARATPDGARAYVAYFRNTLAPELAAIPGHRGALVFESRAADLIEITVQTFWDSMAAVERFAGADRDRAVVEPEARAMLASFDDSVVHREVIVDLRSR
jgi:heme-degrading monooxygenase HmoA